MVHVLRANGSRKHVKGHNSSVVTKVTGGGGEGIGGIGDKGKVNSAVPKKVATSARYTMRIVSSVSVPFHSPLVMVSALGFLQTVVHASRYVLHWSFTQF